MIAINRFAAIIPPSIRRLADPSTVGLAIGFTGSSVRPFAGRIAGHRLPSILDAFAPRQTALRCAGFVRTIFDRARIAVRRLGLQSASLFFSDIFRAHGCMGCAPPRGFVKEIILLSKRVSARIRVLPASPTIPVGASPPQDLIHFNLKNRLLTSERAAVPISAPKNFLLKLQIFA